MPIRTNSNFDWRLKMPMWMWEIIFSWCVTCLVPISATATTTTRTGFTSNESATTTLPSNATDDYDYDYNYDYNYKSPNAPDAQKSLDDYNTESPLSPLELGTVSIRLGLRVRKFIPIFFRIAYFRKISGTRILQENFYYYKPSK